MIRGQFLRYLLLIIFMSMFLGWSLNSGEKTRYTLADPIYQGSQDKKVMTLTCNVFWGEEYLGSMLQTLKNKKVKVTFFIGGSWAEKNPELVKKMYRDGHEIGSHGYAHPHPDQLSIEGNKNDIVKAEKIIQSITGIKPKLFAPPYGERGPAVLTAAEELGYQTILWSIDTIDWQRPGPEVVKSRVVSKAHNGAIVLMHPTAPTAQALPFIIDNLTDQGYRLVTVGELLEQQ